MRLAGLTGLDGLDGLDMLGLMKWMNGLIGISNKNYCPANNFQEAHIANKHIRILWKIL